MTWLNTEGTRNVGVGGGMIGDESAINGVEDIWKVNFKDLTVQDVMSYHFLNVEVAFMFYNWYASMHGFSARKSQYLRNKKGDITQQTFLCYRDGHRRDKFSNTGRIRKRQEKIVIRCGCDAKCRVHVDGLTGQWYITYINDVHNHNLLDDKFVVMLPAYRKMSDYDITVMNDMRKIGIKTPHIYGWLANQVGGYQRMAFRKKDMYNKGDRQKDSIFYDATQALSYLDKLRVNDPMMFWRHSVDGEGRLEQLFWCDGISRGDYLVFGDVVAFDATYKKNKYMCPLVVFSGVNHHNQSIVFAAAIVSNEIEATYVWLL